MKLDKIREFIDIARTSPWKLPNELFMFILKPLAYTYIVFLKNVSLGVGFKFYGLPKILKARGSKIIIDERFENRNWRYSNPLGIDHPTILCTWKREAQIHIGNDVGVSGGSIVAAKKIKIGDGTLIGANVLIIDTDFHPTKGEAKRYKKTGIKESSIHIGKNVFLGTGCVILKGAVIPDNEVIPARVVVIRNERKGYEII